jgi:hypothetical protein
MVLGKPLRFNGFAMKAHITNQVRQQIATTLVRTAHGENMGITGKALRRGTTSICKRFRDMLANGELKTIQEQDIYDMAKHWLFIGAVR